MDFKSNIEQSTEIQKQTQAEALLYFKSNKGFKRLFESFREKYASLGYVGGIVKLSSPSQDEKQALSGFLGKDLSKQKSVAISVANFQKGINNSRFEGISVEWLVSAYFDDQLLYKKDLRQQAELEQKEFFEKLIVESRADEKTIEWLQGAISDKIAPYSQLIHEYNQNREILYSMMTRVLQGLSALPKQIMRIPVFAARITGDPHYFDKNGKAYIYLLHGVYHRVYGSFLTNAALNSEEETEILYKAGLMKDDVSNFVMCYGIRGAIGEDEYSGINCTTSGVSNGNSAKKQKDKFKEHSGLKGFFDLGEPSMLSLLNINKLDAAYSVNDHVFVFENPSVFAEFIEGDRQYYEKSFKSRCGVAAICSAGQPNLAVLLLLDLLVDSGTEIYYSGDFDPEGLLIADRLKMRYNKRLKLWHFGLEDYNFTMSKKDIPEKRLKQLEKLQDKELIKVGKAMQKFKKAGYQEKLIEKLVKDEFD